MARKSKADVAKAKAAKQKKIAIVGGVLLVVVMAIQVPRTMKMLNKKPKPPAVAAVSRTPGDTTATSTTATPAVDPNSLSAPTLAGTPTVTTTASSSELVSAVPVQADPGQLETFQRFASKDPFAAQVSATAPTSSGGGGATSGGGTVTTAAPTTPAPKPSPAKPAVTAPVSAVISLNGELMSVAVDSDFPTAGVTYSHVGSIFHLVSLTAKRAKVSIVGGSYADGAPAITLDVGTPLTLQNTADGTKYTLILEPQGTPLPAASTPAGAPTSTTATAPAGAAVVPVTGGNG